MFEAWNSPFFLWCIIALEAVIILWLMFIRNRPPEGTPPGGPGAPRL